MSSNRQLDRSEVVGRVLVEIRQTSKVDDDGVDWCQHYICLNSGVVFSLPREEFFEGLIAGDLPDHAEPITHSWLPEIYGKQIIDVVHPTDEWPNESLYLVLENGYLVGDVMAAMHGTGEAGIYFLRPGTIDSSGLKSIWK